jgi:hypothetical protein
MPIPTLYRSWILLFSWFLIIGSILSCTSCDDWCSSVVFNCINYCYSLLHYDNVLDLHFKMPVCINYGTILILPPIRTHVDIFTGNNYRCHISFWHPLPYTVCTYNYISQPCTQWACMLGAAILGTPLNNGWVLGSLIKGTLVVWLGRRSSVEMDNTYIAPSL